MKRCFITMFILIGITSVLWNVEYQLRVERLIKENEKMLLEIKEKDQLIGE